MLHPLPVAESYSILSPEAVSRVEPLRWAQQAKTFLGADVSVEGGSGDDMTLVIAPAGGGSGTRVGVRSLPVGECPDVMIAANRGVEAIGGAGMDVLVARTQRVWQVELVDDRRLSLVAAALLASVLLGPIVPPDEVTIYGVKGARVRLEKMGWAI
jgi:hypothetical protein